MRTCYDGICRLGEGPIYDERTDTLFWTDILGGFVYRFPLGEGSKAERLLEQDRVGALLLDREGRLLLLGSKGVGAMEQEGTDQPRSIRWLLPWMKGEGGRFNDAIADPVGRILAGTLRDDHRDGHVWQFPGSGQVPDSAWEILLSGIGISNGMAFSEDGRYLYHTDSKTATITRYHYDPAGGGLSEPRIWVDLSSQGLVPDGMTMDAEGDLWVACWGGGQVIRIGQSGRVRDILDVPARLVTSVAFGGAKYDRLFITTAGYGGDADGNDSEGVHLGGEVFECRPGVSGRPEFLVSLPVVPVTGGVG